MHDPRLTSYAKLMVNYALGVEKGNEVLIAGSHLAAPLVREMYRQVLASGGHPRTQIGLDGLGEILYKEGSDDQLTYVASSTKSDVENVDRLLQIRSPENTKALSGVPADRMRLNQQAHSKIIQRYFEREAKGELRWSMCQFPTHASAQEANMSLDEYHDFVLGACLLTEPDPVKAWRGVEQKQEKICAYLATKNDFHVTAAGTDLSYCAEGRVWINCCGKNNMPDGEVFTGPVEDSVSGHITFSFPGIFMGKEIEGIRLEFKDGRVVDAAAERGEELLQTLLDTDEGSRKVGEAAIGTNYGITQFTKNMLFDEKIGGTCHFALGHSLPGSGGVNQSSLHWDMLCDLRTGGSYTADGEVF
ncbi:MAG: peptidase M29, partial [Candidatus Coatesbacteria bacterium RBG_13_66_14]